MSAEVLVRRQAPEDLVGPVIAAAFADEGEMVARLWAELEQSDAVRASLDEQVQEVARCAPLITHAGRRSHARPPGLTHLVAEQDGEVVGHVGLSHAWLDARRELLDVWLLSPLSVVATQQGHGTGTALVAAAVELARSSGTPLLFLEGDPGYYGSRGFERASTHGFVPASARTPDAAFQVVRFAGHEDWMTGQLSYRDVWWRHAAAGLRDPLLTQIEESTR